MLLKVVPNVTANSILGSGHKGRLQLETRVPHTGEKKSAQESGESQSLSTLVAGSQKAWGSEGDENYGL